MHNIYPPSERVLLRVSLDTLVADHGAWRVVRAAIAALVRRRKRYPTVRPQDLPNAIRRDVGLEPIVDPPSHWDYR